MCQVICFATSLQLHLFDVVILSCCNQRLLQIFLVALFLWSATNTNPYHTLWLIVDKEMEIMDLLFKRVLFIIRFLICIKKGLMFLFYEFLNVEIM